jgi:hypothetical protein
MRAKDIIPEAQFGTTTKRPARVGSRPERGHEAQPRYKAYCDACDRPKADCICDKTNEGVINVPELSKRIIQMRKAGQTDEQIKAQFVKEGIPSRFIDQAFAGVDVIQNEAVSALEAELASIEESGKASRQLCKSSKPDAELGASQLASCKSQGLRARDGEKSHLIGHGQSAVRITVGGKKIKGKKYGGPLPDYGTRKGQ